MKTFTYFPFSLLKDRRLDRANECHSSGPLDNLFLHYLNNALQSLAAL